MIAIYKQYFAAELATQIEIPREDILALIEIPPENIPGDLAFPCFQLAKQAKKSPNILAKEFCSPFFEKFEAVGGYVNAHINKNKFINEFFSSNVSMFQSSNLSTKPKVLIEYMSANPNKPLHI